jgi:hypothetical protein
MREKVTEAIRLARTGKKRSEDENRNHTEVTEKNDPTRVNQAGSLRIHSSNLINSTKKTDLPSEVRSMIVQSGWIC